VIKRLKRSNKRKKKVARSRGHRSLNLKNFVGGNQSNSSQESHNADGRKSEWGELGLGWGVRVEEFTKCVSEVTTQSRRSIFQKQGESSRWVGQGWSKSTYIGPKVKKNRAKNWEKKTRL